MRLLVLTAASVLAAPAVAQAPAASAWTVDKAASQVGFQASLSGAAFEGDFGRWDARIQFDPNNLPASKVVAVIDLASARTGDGAKDEALPSSDWFDVKRHPRATFVTRSITSRGPNTYLATGDLTLRGVTRPVVLPFTLAISGDTAKMSGAAVLDRTAFGVGQGQWRATSAVPAKVTVTVRITAKRAR